MFCELFANAVLTGVRTVCQHLTLALADAAGVQVGGGGSLGAGLTLQLPLLVLVGAQPAALTLVVLQREVCSHRTLDWRSARNKRSNATLLWKY